MNKVDDCKLDNIYGGGTTITGTLVNALTDIIKILYDAGHAVGSSARRVKEDNLCSLE